ncbi:hypothetical protein DH2020_048789 [Rehmannia glutinosa]|uniref:Disease resistance R13L4/SHOC-2-like LRR domain-containing protein n=1 Tax=Rehmannia glutinosa TaxID=99300 RepID=A0ABR0U5E1_REHGL
MAYAAVILLMRNLEEILLPDSYPIHLKKDQIEYLQKEFSLFLKLFMEDSQESEYDHEVAEKLEIKIRDLAHKVTDFIDAQIYIINARPAFLPERDLGLKKISLIAHQSFAQIVDEIKPVKLEVVQLFENMKSDGKTIPAPQDLTPSSSNSPQDLTPSSSNSPQDLTPSSSNTENKLVGIDTDIEELLERLNLIHLRYLALAINCELPRSIFKLQNLKTLIIDHIWEGGQYLPWEIWKMPQLRHIRLKRGCYFPHPYSRGVEDKGQLVLKNLHTLSTIIGPVSCSIQVFSCLPGLRKLKIFATENDSQTDRSSNSLTNLVCLNQLETLKCSFLYRPREHQLPRGHNFPANLKKLALSGSYLPWEDMATLAVLPKLEVLKLTSFAFDGYKWTTVEDGFVELKILLLENSDPKIWDADDFHFPKLQQLVLRECHRLTEIPEGIGNILTLQMIEVQDCSFCVIQSARKIHEQQQMLGNFEVGVQLLVREIKKARWVFAMKSPSPLSKGGFAYLLD